MIASQPNQEQPFSARSYRCATNGIRRTDNRTMEVLSANQAPAISTVSSPLSKALSKAKIFAPDLPNKAGALNANGH